MKDEILEKRVFGKGEKRTTEIAKDREKWREIWKSKPMMIKQAQLSFSFTPKAKKLIIKEVYLEKIWYKIWGISAKESKSTDVRFITTKELVFMFTS